MVRGGADTTPMDPLPSSPHGDAPSAPRTGLSVDDLAALVDAVAGSTFTPADVAELAAVTFGQVIDPDALEADLKAHAGLELTDGRWRPYP